MQATASRSENPLVNRILAWCATAWNQAGNPDAWALQDDRLVDALARDVGVSADTLLRLVEAGPHAADEMAAMMRALNIDASEVQVADVAAFRDMQATCAGCTHKSRCRGDLAAETAADHFAEYCGNADLLNALRAEPEVLRD